MAIKKYLIIWICLLFAMSVQAQDFADFDSLADINVIKRDTSYIYAESTRLDAVEALSDARIILEIKLQDWLRYKHIKEDASSLISNSKERWLSLLTKRGKYKRVFVYVSKRDVLPMPETLEAVTLDAVSLSEEPVVVPEDVRTFELTNEEEEMAAITGFADIEPYVKGLKNEGKLRAYGKYASLPEDDACHIFIYDRDGDVVAVIRQTADGHQYNLRTKNDDNVRNYKNCGAIWLQLK